MRGQGRGGGKPANEDLRVFVDALRGALRLDPLYEGGEIMAKRSQAGAFKQHAARAGRPGDSPEGRSGSQSVGQSTSAEP